MLKVLRWAAIAVVAVAALAYAAFQLSSWPSVLLIRMWFDKDTQAMSTALEKHVPLGVTTLFDQRYDSNDSDAYLDVFRPEGTAQPLPAIVWVHGGAFVYGDRSNVTNYLKILAAKGYAAVAVGYSLAPGSNYPTPVLQVNRALGYLTENAERLNIDPARIVVAGDSAGAQIAGQLSLLITSPAYAGKLGVKPAISAENLRGAILFCGALDASRLNFEGPFGAFITTVLWAYMGKRDFIGDPRLKDFSIPLNMTKDYPPFFISVGNGDPLAPSSYDTKAKADALGVANDALFFPAEHQPPLPHEYQFNLDSTDGKLALERVLAFLSARTAK